MGFAAGPSSQKVGPIAVFLLALLLLPAHGALAQSAGSSVAVPSGILYYVPITIENTQPIPTSAPFQQLLTVDSASYSSIEASNLQNVEFFDAGGNVVPSWLESGDSNLATGTVYWLLLGSGIPGDSQAYVYMGFGSVNVNLFNSLVTGEAPQLSPVYGEYDDGARVFGFYDNFAGNALNPMWSTYLQSGESITVSNGATFTSLYKTSTTIYSRSVVSSTQWLEAYVSSESGTGQYDALMYSLTPPTAAPPYTSFNWLGYTDAYGAADANGVSRDLLKVVGGSETILTSAPSYAAPFISQLAWPTSGSETEMINYGNSLSSNDNSFASTNCIVSFSSYGNDGSGTVSLNWIRQREYPPNGVMPMTVLGAPTPIVTTTVTQTVTTTLTSTQTIMQTSTQTIIQATTMTIISTATVPTTTTTATTSSTTATVTTTTTASTYAYVSLGVTAIVVLIVVALAAWVLRGRRP